MEASSCLSARLAAVQISLLWFCAPCARLSNYHAGQMVAPNFKLKLAFNCECNPEKQGWAENEIWAELQFKDVNDLQKARAPTRDKRMCLVPKTGWFIFGFSCRDMSSLNTGSSTFQLNSGLGSSGATWLGCLAYIKSHHPPCVVRWPQLFLFF